MRWIAGPAMALCFLILAGAASAEQKASGGKQSYESCGLITSEYLTVLQLVSRGFTPENLKQALPDISPKAGKRVDRLVGMAKNDGLIDTYSTINSEYASCARKVFNDRGLPAKGSREAHFHRCAGENKVRYEVTIAALIGASRSDVVKQLDPSHRPDAEKIFREINSKGGLGTFDRLATELKRCLAAIP